MTNDSEETDDEAIHVGSYGADESVSVCVASALAEILDAEPTSIDLYENVDPEALDRLFEPTRDGTPRKGRAVFEAEGYRVTVRSDGTFTIAQPDE